MSDLVERLRAWDCDSYSDCNTVCVLAADRIEALESLISEESIERFAKDIACAVVEPRKEIVDMRHRAMVRLGQRLREPLLRDLEFVSALNRSHGADNG